MVQVIVWVEPTYTAVHKVLTHPVYAGAYVFGKSRFERCQLRAKAEDVRLHHTHDSRALEVGNVRPRQRDSDRDFGPG